MAKLFEMIGINRDITEQKAAAELLRLSEEQSRLATEANDVGTWGLRSGHRRPRHWSPIFRRLWGLPPDAPADSALLHPLAAERDWQRSQEVWNEGINPDGNGRVRAGIRGHPRRRRRPPLVLLRRPDILRSGDQESRGGAVGIMTDVTERKSLEERQRLILREMNHRVKNKPGAGSGNRPRRRSA